MKRCAYCGKEMDTVESRKKYCSKECYAKNNSEASNRKSAEKRRERRREWRKENGTTCIVCGKEIPLDARRKLYCSDGCMVKENRSKTKKERPKKKVPTNMNQLAFINECARTNGMTYGQYMAQRQV